MQSCFNTRTMNTGNCLEVHSKLGLYLDCRGGECFFEAAINWVRMLYKRKLKLRNSMRANIPT